MTPMNGGLVGQRDQFHDRVVCRGVAEEAIADSVEPNEHKKRSPRPPRNVWPIPTPYRQLGNAERSLPDLGTNMG